MSRFKGWTASAVERLQIGGTVRISAKAEKVREIPRETNKTGIPTTDHVGQIVTALEVLGVGEVKREYKFLHDRRFRFDIAIPSAMVAIEFEGGVWTNGRHTRGKGYVNDVKKYNLATMHGWKLLRYTAEDTKQENWQYVIAAEIKKFIEREDEKRR